MSEHQHFPISVLLYTKDIQKSIAFYRDQLGFQLELAWPEGPQPLYAGLHLDHQSVMLGVPTPKEAAHSLCGEDPQAIAEAASIWEAMQKHPAGVGVAIYLQVADVDRYHALLRQKGVKELSEPRTQFYGQRDFWVRDPNGYKLFFYAPVAMSSCQSCGMPLQDAKAGAMYCQYCSDAKGRLKPYDQVLEGTTVGYFMGMKKLPRAEAEQAARAHLAAMPAWKARK